MTKTGETHDETRPFAKLNGDDLYQLPDGTPHRISDVIAFPDEGIIGIIALSKAKRYVEEVKLIQASIGVPQTGAIDEDTRIACREIAGYRWDDVGLVFQRMWTTAHHLAQDCRAKGQTLGAEIAAYLHDEIVNGIRELKREEPLNVSTPRPTIGDARKAEDAATPETAPDDRIDVSASLIAADRARMKSALDWIINHPDSGDVVAVAKQGLGISLADHDTPPSAPVIVERWALEEMFHFSTTDAGSASISYEALEHLKARIAG